MSNEYFEKLSKRLEKFAMVRDWDQFHAPKNLVMALSVEAAELTEHFQWLTEEQSENLPPHKLEEVATELADTLLYLIRLADKLLERDGRMIAAIQALSPSAATMEANAYSIASCF